VAIQEITVSGFRSLRDVNWKPGRLNLLVGPNGRGKSNLIRCLELISDAAEGEIESRLTTEGGIFPILWDHQVSGRCGWKLRIDPVDKPRDTAKDALTYELEIAQIPGAGSAYEITKDTLGNWYPFEQGHQKSPFWIFRRDARRAQLFDQQQGELVTWEEVASDNLDGYNENESLLSQIADMRNRIPRLVRRELEGWSLHHDVHVERGSMMRRPVTTQFTKRLASDGSNLAAVLHTLYTGNPTFREQIDDGMRAGFGEEYARLEFQPAAAQQIQLAVLWKSSSQPHAGSDLSDGTLRFLFLLTVLAHPEPPALIAVDEPEVGLHPSMVSILAEYASEASQRTQVVLTSHSPEFLDAFTELSPQVSLCHWEDGQTLLFQIDECLLNKWLTQYRLGHIFKRGDLESLALPGVDEVDDMAARFSGLPPEDAAMAGLSGDS